MPTNSTFHFCSVQANIGEEICCQLVRLLNVPEKVPFCDSTAIRGKSNANGDKQNWTDTSANEFAAQQNRSAAISTLFQRSYPKFGPPSPSMNLKVPPDEVPEEHLTFLFGVFMLISMAVVCTLFLMKLAKAGSPDPINPRCLGGILPSDYSLMLWMPGSSTNGGASRTHRPAPAPHHRSRHHRPPPPPPSLFFLLRSSFRCAGRGSAVNENAASSTSGSTNIPSARSSRSTSRRPMAPRSGRSCLSIVSSSSMNALLPNTITPSSSSGSAGLAGLAAFNASTSSSSGTIPPPPCYEELEEFTTPRYEEK